MTTAWRLKRTYYGGCICAYIGIVVFSVANNGPGHLHSTGAGTFWREQAKDQQQKFVEIDAQRGTIYSEDGRMLSTSTPYFDIYIDFAAEGVTSKEWCTVRE